MNVTDYYDENTGRFLRFGVGKGEYAIHRPVWGPGVSTRAEALHYAEELIIDRMTGLGIRDVFDMGCGVGGTIRYMRGRFPAGYRGITISPVQAGIAERILGGGVVRTGDMTDQETLHELFAGARRPAAVICVEAFLHLPENRKWFSLLAPHTAPGDLLVLQDDFLSSRRDPGRRGARFLAEFESGWKASALLTPGEVCAAAAAAGFARAGDVDLTPMLEDRPLRRLSIAALVGVLRPFGLHGGWFDNYLGGNALQQCIRRGLTTYRQLVFVRE